MRGLHLRLCSCTVELVIIPPALVRLDIQGFQGQRCCAVRLGLCQPAQLEARHGPVGMRQAAGRQLQAARVARLCLLQAARLEVRVAGVLPALGAGGCCGAGRRHARRAGGCHGHRHPSRRDVHRRAASAPSATGRCSTGRPGWSTAAAVAGARCSCRAVLCLCQRGIHIKLIPLGSVVLIGVCCRVAWLPAAASACRAGPLTAAASGRVDWRRRRRHLCRSRCRRALLPALAGGLLGLHLLAPAEQLLHVLIQLLGVHSDRRLGVKGCRHCWGNVIGCMQQR